MTDYLHDPKDDVAIDDPVPGPTPEGIAALDTALTLLDGTGPKTAMCPRNCGEPLVSTFERRGAEFHCLACGGWFGFLAPKPAVPTPVLDARTTQLEALFAGGLRGPVELPAPA